MIAFQAADAANSGSHAYRDAIAHVPWIASNVKQRRSYGNGRTAETRGERRGFCRTKRVRAKKAVTQIFGPVEETAPLLSLLTSRLSPPDTMVPDEAGLTPAVVRALVVAET